MSQDISLQALIDKVKKDLLSLTGGPEYPIFFVDNIELELQLVVTQEKSEGLKISVLEFGGVEGSRSTAHERGHTVKLTLSPILSREEQRQLLQSDKRMWDGIQRATQAALRKGDDNLAGEPE